jgi:hypothetical protein
MVAAAAERAARRASSSVPYVCPDVLAIETFWPPSTISASDVQVPVVVWLVVTKTRRP